MYKKLFGNNIRKYRKINNLSQESLGKLLCTTKQNISSWERDRTQPSNTDLDKMAEIFNCNVDEITGAEFEKIINKSAKTKDSIEQYYLEKEINAIAIRYADAPEYVKEGVCKLLDIDRSFFSMDKYMKEGD